MKTNRTKAEKFKELADEANGTMRQGPLAGSSRTPFDTIGSATDNAGDTWKEQRRTDFYSDEYYTFAFDSLVSLLCDSEPDDVCAWFKARGVKW